VPAAAVIPAPGAYTKVVVVKKLVVVVVFGGSYLVVAVRRLTRVPYRHLARLLALREEGPNYCEQKEAFQAGSTAVNTPAWNNAIGLAPIGWQVALK
jgi:hypothetical protein